VPGPIYSEPVKYEIRQEKIPTHTKLWFGTFEPVLETLKPGFTEVFLEYRCSFPYIVKKRPFGRTPTKFRRVFFITSTRALSSCIKLGLTR
jgi:hypothetical protein